MSKHTELWNYIIDFITICVLIFTHAEMSLNNHKLLSSVSLSVRCSPDCRFQNRSLAFCKYTYSSIFDFNAHAFFSNLKQISILQKKD